jgi:hypothetical protein
VAQGVRFTIGELPYVVTGIEKHGEIRLTCTVGGASLRLNRTQLYEGVRVEEILPWGSQEKSIRRIPYLDYEALTGDQREEVARKMRYIVTLDKLGKVSYRRSTAIFAATVAALARAMGDPCPPAPTTAYDTLLAYRNSGLDAQAFARQLVLKLPRGPQDKELADIIDAATIELHQARKAPPTNADIQELVNKRYRALQRQRVKAGGVPTPKVRHG